MTNRDFYNAVISNEVNAEVIAFATEALNKLDTKNSKRAIKSREANEPFRQAILEFLQDKDFTLGTEIAKTFEGQATPQKIIGLLNALCKESVCVKHEVKIAGVGTRMAYKLV